MPYLFMAKHTIHTNTDILTFGNTPLIGWSTLLCSHFGIFSRSLFCCCRCCCFSCCCGCGFGCVGKYWEHNGVGHNCLQVAVSRWEVVKICARVMWSALTLLSCHAERERQRAREIESHVESQINGQYLEVGDCCKQKQLVCNLC